MDDNFMVKEDVESTSSRIFAHLKSVGYKPEMSPNGIQVRTGSAILFRLFGIPLGSNSLPLGLDVQMAPIGDGTRVTSAAYDRLGWYLNKRPLWGEQVLDRKLTGLLNVIRTAAGEGPVPEKKANYNP